jgi:hypothetical protein
MSEQTARNILSALDGDPIRQNVINQEVLATEKPSDSNDVFAGPAALGTI